jgi:Subtilisin inhibitor-like
MLALAATALSIAVTPATGPTHHWTLRCDPLGGTLPHRAGACRKLDALRDPFAETPRDTVCADVFSGPERAVVRGRFEGRPVSTTFSRRDSCETARWSRVRFLFPIRLS